MATMYVPGHDRDALPCLLTTGDGIVTLDVSVAAAMTDDDLAQLDTVVLVPTDEYEPTSEDLATVRMFLSLTDDAPEVVGYDDARQVLDQLAHDEWANATEAA